MDIDKGNNFKEWREMMTEHVKEEVRMLNQLLLAMFITINYALFCLTIREEFPWLSYACMPIGLSIILVCSTGKKWMLFNIWLIICGMVVNIVFNWTNLFSVH